MYDDALSRAVNSAYANAFVSGALTGWKTYPLAQTVQPVQTAQTAPKPQKTQRRSSAVQEKHTVNYAPAPEKQEKLVNFNFKKCVAAAILFAVSFFGGAVLFHVFISD